MRDFSELPSLIRDGSKAQTGNGLQPQTFWAKALKQNPTLYPDRSTLQAVVEEAGTQDGILNMQLISQPTSLQEIWEKRSTDFVEVLKIVVDVDKEIVAADAEINIRPSQGNRSMEVTDDKIRKKITQIVNHLFLRQ